MTVVASRRLTQLPEGTVNGEWLREDYMAAPYLTHSAASASSQSTMSVTQPSR